MSSADEHTLAFLLAFDGRIHHLEGGYWLKFEIKHMPVTSQRPHGLSYSFTLHDPDGARIMGFDNAHAVPPKGARFKARTPQNDHWHRTVDDAGRPYPFTSADQLLADFFAEVRRILTERGVSDTVIGEGAIEDKEA
ncbi:MAG TPA: hypothetical protein DCL54_13220 [Alphaproteobacteria bacterium]|nr:hypothetical protein [Alphaproteobacteria bacterium]HAJ47530.1 hypothetical protein [Alphaproteobacteria bacterium]